MIIVPNKDEEGMPEDLKNMQEILMFMNSIPVVNDNIADIEAAAHGHVISDFGEEDLLLLNGKQIRSSFLMREWEVLCTLKNKIDPGQR